MGGLQQRLNCVRINFLHIASLRKSGRIPVFMKVIKMTKIAKPAVKARKAVPAKADAFNAALMAAVTVAPASATDVQAILTGDEQMAIMVRLEGLNYYGKRLDSARAQVVEQMAKELEVSEGIIMGVIALNPRPAKAEKAKQAKAAAVDTRPISGGALSHTESTRPVKEGQRFLVTSAQNNTHVHEGFMKNLEAYAVKIGAQIVVFPFIYNKNGFQNGVGGDDIWYACEVRPYLQNESVWLGEQRKVAAMAFNILPTVKSPLGGMKEAVGSAEALIVPHATIAHENIAVLGAQYGAVVPGMYSTGAVTQRNYIQQQAGQKAENRHNFGALIVEFNEHGQFWIRQIETDETGAFSDLRDFVNAGAVLENVDTVSVINYGDIHAEKSDNAVAAIQWGAPGYFIFGRIGCGTELSMLDYFRPEYQMCHDLLDFSSLNHHNRENHYHMARNQVTGATVKQDLIDVANILESMERPWCQTVVVRSNHDDALDRWLADAKYEPRKDPANAVTYYSLQLQAYRMIAVGSELVSLPYALKEIAEMENAYHCKFLRASEDFKVGPVQLGEHGHSGTNGSRGSPKQFASNKCTTGHTHTSSIYGGCYTAGVSGKLAMGYNETGASSWVHACVIQYKTGFRTIMAVKDNGAGQLAYMA